MPPRAPQQVSHYGTVLDPFINGAARAAYEGLSAEPYTFGLGFALFPWDPIQQTAWITIRFGSIPEGVYWLKGLESHGGHVYAAIFTRTLPQHLEPMYGRIPSATVTPLAESFGQGTLDLVTTLIPKLPMHCCSGDRRSRAMQSAAVQKERLELSFSGPEPDVLPITQFMKSFSLQLPRYVFLL